MRKAIVAGMVALCGMTVTSSAVVRQVPSEYPRIQSAIDAAEQGDTVLVSPGVYYETINFGGKDILVTSTDPNDPRIVGYTIINADGDGTVVTFENGETNAAVLRGFTITGGFGTLNNDQVGGQFRLFWGAGIYCNNASPTITRNVIANNRAPTEIMAANQADIIESYGGGIACFNSSAVVSYNTIKGNSATIGGGVLSYAGKTKFVGNLIYDNSAVLGGGAVMIEGYLLNNTLVGNYAEEMYGTPGGNVYAVFGVGLANCAIWNNIISDAPSGGGIAWEGDMPDFGVVLYNDVWNNSPGNYGASDPTTGSVTWDGTSDFTDRAGNISADPLFANPAGKDFHLTVDSPCVDMGDPETELIPGELDIDHTARVYGSCIDMGADEFIGYVKPVAEAGLNQHFLQPLVAVTLDGKGSFFYDPCGVQTYRWSQLSGPAIVFDDPNQVQPTFTPSVEGEYVFQLVVADDRYSSGADNVTILVGANQPPVANAGPTQARPLGGLAFLDGADSFDPDKVDQLTYQWTQLSGTPVELRDANTARPSFDLRAEGVYIFELVVSDGFSQSAPSQVQCIGVNATFDAEVIKSMQSGVNGFYPDVSGTTAVYCVPGQAAYYDFRIVTQDLVSGKVETFTAAGLNLQPKIDGNFVVWSNGPSTAQGLVPGSTGIFVRNLTTGEQRELRSRGTTESYSHPAISGNKVVWLQHVGIDPSSLATWSNMPYDICGVDLTNFDKPVYFTIATNVGKRDPYMYRNPTTDFDHVIDISGNIVVWEGNGDIYAADISDVKNIKIITVCNHPARQYNPSISGRRVVWTDERNDKGDVYGADLSDWQQVKEFVVAKGPGIQGQAAIDGCHIVYADGSKTGGQLTFACVTRNYGILTLTVTDPLVGAQPVLDGPTFLWTQTSGVYVLGLRLRFSYPVADGRVQLVQAAARATKRYDYIQHAICAAADGDVIVIGPDRYEEKISFLGKNITVRSPDPNDPAVVETTVLAGPGSLVTFMEGEQAGSILRGLTIEGGTQGIVCNSAAPTIVQCTIRGSAQAGVRSSGTGGLTLNYCRILAHGAAGVELTSTGEGRVLKQGEATLSNCLIAGNAGAGVHGGKPTLINCTVVENQGAGVSATGAVVTNSIVYFNNQAAKGTQIEGTRAAVTYSDVQGGYAGEGNLKADPLFVALGRWSDPSSATGAAPALGDRLSWIAGDYHLKSQGWRWNAKEGIWTSDEVTSPCIDAGDPDAELLAEPLTAPNDSAGTVINKRIDMGAYGGTPEASLAPAKP